jgi:hypothetical protein
MIMQKTAKFFHSKYVFFVAKQKSVILGHRLYFGRRTSLKALKKSMAEKIGSEKKWIFTIAFIKT